MAGKQWEGQLLLYIFRVITNISVMLLLLEIWVCIFQLLVHKFSNVKLWVLCLIPFYWHIHECLCVIYTYRLRSQWLRNILILFTQYESKIKLPFLISVLEKFSFVRQNDIVVIMQTKCYEWKWAAPFHDLLHFT